MKFSTQKPSCGCVTQKAKNACPSCGMVGISVSSVTMNSQLKKEYLKELKDRDGFAFCQNQVCNIVYYKGVSSFDQEQIRNRVTIKDSDPQTPLCYCKKFLKKEFFEMLERGEEDIGSKVKEIITGGKSFCEKSNPRGTCCNNDVREFLGLHKIAWK